MTVSHTAGPILIREIITGLERPGPNQEWTDVAEKFQTLDFDQRIRLAIRVANILELSNALHVSKRRL